MIKKTRSRGGKLLLSGRFSLIAGIILTAAGAAMLIYLYGIEVTVPQMDTADGLLIFPMIFKLLEAINAALLLRTGRILGIIFLAQGMGMTAGGIYSIVNGKRLLEKERAEAAEKLRLLYEEGALTDEEYAELTERLTQSR